MLEKFIENWTSRLDYIRASRDSPMPEIIFKISTSLAHDRCGRFCVVHKNKNSKFVVPSKPTQACEDEFFAANISDSDEVHFWLNGYVNKQNCRIWSEVNPQVYVETTLHSEKLTVWRALWAGGILLQKR
ncbi:hypothetical protein TNCV_2801771 [Trichonephila clavipes]|nr:hypothetical protein TNCV_2801771 [Trichonephila clavipes]